MNDRINVRIDNKLKKKALIILETKGKNLSDEVRKFINNIILEENEQKNSK